MSFSRKIEERVYPEFDFPLVAHVAIVLFPRFGKKIPDEIVSLVVSSAKANRDLMRTTGELIKQFNSNFDNMPLTMREGLGKITADQISESIILTSGEQDNQARLRLATAILSVGVEIAESFE